MTFGELIRHAREARGLSQSEVERQTRRTTGYLCRLEQGHLGPPPKDGVDALADALELEPAELWRIAAYQRDPDVFEAGYRAARMDLAAELVADRIRELADERLRELEEENARLHATLERVRRAMEGE